MTPEQKEIVAQIVREQMSSLIKSDRFTFEKLLQILDGRNIQTGTSVGTKIGTSTTQKLGFFNKAPVVQQTSASLTNNVTAGGSNDVIANFTDLTTYSADAATIRNDIYQLARKLKEVGDALRTLGLLG